MDIGQAHPDYIKSPHVVLVVHDELFLLEYVRLVLVRSGFRVMTANTGEEAWQLISNPANSISLVLLMGLNWPREFAVANWGFRFFL